MTVVSFALVGIIMYVLGRFLVRYLGWPTDVAGAGRWGLTLFTAAVLLGGLPELLRHFEATLPPLPRADFLDVVLGAVIVGLGVLGYVAWSGGKNGKGRDTERLLPRKRAAPPPPAFAPEPDEFAPVAGGEDDQEEPGV